MPPGHNALIDRLAKSHGKVVVVLSNGSPVEMPWINVCPASLKATSAARWCRRYCGRPLRQGQSHGSWPKTFPLKLEDTPAYHTFPGGPAVVEYRESLYVGYRYYDSVGQDVLFPFGFGLSYTTFEYSDLKLMADGEGVTVSLKIRNVGDIEGKEIVQVYVHDVESTAFRPEKELKGFTKVHLEPGETTEASIELSRRAFTFYDPSQRDWIVETGDFNILVGASSRDIRLSGTIRIESKQVATPPTHREDLEVYYNPQKGRKISQAEFETLLGSPIPPNKGPEKGHYTLNTPVSDMTDSFIGRLVFKFMQKQIRQMIQGQEDTPNGLFMQVMVKEMPLRSTLMMSGGPLDRRKLEALLMMINGQIFQRIGRNSKSEEIPLIDPESLARHEAFSTKQPCNQAVRM